MPWDSTRLVVADLTTDGAGSPQVIAGGDGISVAQPQFADDGTLWFISDESGWWNLHRWDGGHATRVHPVDADLAQPQWVLGMVDYALLPDGRVLTVVGWTSTRDWPSSIPPGTLSRTSTTRASCSTTSSPSAPRSPSDVASQTDCPRWCEDPGRRPNHRGELGAGTPRPGIRLARGGPDVDQRRGSRRPRTSLPAGEPGGVRPEGERPPLLVFVHGGPRAAPNPPTPPSSTSGPRGASRSST